MEARTPSILQPTLAIVIFVASFVLGLAFNFFFYAKYPGLSFPVFVGLIVAGLSVLCFYNHRPLSRSVVWLLAPLAVFSGLLAVRASPSLALINVVASLAILLLIANLAAGGDLRKFRVGNYLSAMVTPLKFFTPLANVLVSLSSLGSQSRHHRNTAQIVRGIIITIPILIIFLVLLSSADLIFQKYVLSLFNFHLSPETISRGVLVLFITVGFIGAYGYVFTPATTAVDANAKAPMSHLGQIESNILLGSVNALFLAFIAVQLAYLFGGQQNISAAGFTYAEYARKGFFELIFVAVLSFILIWVTERQTTKPVHAKHSPQFKTLVVALIVQVLIIMVSAFKRLFLYEEAYGFTALRFFSHAVIILLAIIFLFLLYKIWRDGRDETFAISTFGAVLLFVFALNAINPDAFIARQNIDRLNATGKLDTYYLAHLSADALPTIIAAESLQNPKFEPSLADELGRNYAAQAKDSYFRGWQAWNFSRSRAKQLIAEHPQPTLPRLDSAPQL